MLRPQQDYLYSAGFPSSGPPSGHFCMLRPQQDYLYSAGFPSSGPPSGHFCDNFARLSKTVEIKELRKLKTEFQAFLKPLSVLWSAKV